MAKTSRAPLFVSLAHRERLNAAADRAGVGQRVAIEAMIDAFADGEIKIYPRRVVAEERKDGN